MLRLMLSKKVTVKQESGRYKGARDLTSCLNGIGHQFYDIQASWASHGVTLLLPIRGNLMTHSICVAGGKPDHPFCVTRRASSAGLSCEHIGGSSSRSGGNSVTISDLEPDSPTDQTTSRALS